jgi:hypothetical protein
MDAKQKSWLRSYVERQDEILDDIFKLMPDADSSHISALCTDTAASMLEIGCPIPINLSIHPDNHFSFLSVTKGNILPEITQRWRDWETEYLKLREQYPMLELHDLIAAMALAYFCQHWPYGYEICVLEWVQQDNYNAMSHFIRPPKFGFDRRSISKDFYERMRVLQGTLDGWIVKRRFGEIGTYFIRTDEAAEWLSDSNKVNDEWMKTKWGMQNEPHK